MPTGYTAKLMEQGESFEDFALRCARAFGALIMLRDEPMDKPIPERFEPSDYHTKSLATARAELVRLEELGGTERIAYGQSLRDAEILSASQSLGRARAENARLELMREKVKAWKSPSPDHDEYKNFMLEQIKISMNTLTYDRKRAAEAESKTPAEYYAHAVSKALRDIDYHTSEHAKEVARTASRNKWLADLRRSLISPDAAASIATADTLNTQEAK